MHYKPMSWLALLFTSILVLFSACNVGAEEEKGLFVQLGSQGNKLAPPSPLMNNLSGRKSTSLNGMWNIVVDEHEWGDKGVLSQAYFNPTPLDGTGMQLREYAFDERRQLRVPGDWNTQDDTLFRYRGVVWYQRNFELVPEAGKRYFLHFDGVNYFASVYLNGKPMAGHSGGYTAFNVDITDAVKKGDNFLVVRVDAYLDDTTVPTRKTSDFFKYGGITRDVNLVEVPETYIHQYHLYLEDHETGLVKGWAQLEGRQSANTALKLEIPELKVSQTVLTDEKGRVAFSFNADLSLWSPETPTLYRVILSALGNSIRDDIGFRTVRTSGHKILLNGKPVYFRGVSLHDESFLKSGVGYDKQDAEAQLNLIKELNGNYVRLAHYPHNEHTVKLADKLGLMVWSEIPIVSVIDWRNPHTLDLARNQLNDNIHRDLNRAAIVMWSVANETQPESAERLAFLSTLAEDARTLDQSKRPIAAALIGNYQREFTQIYNRLIAEMLADKNIINKEVRSELQTLANELFDGDIDSVRKKEIEVLLTDKLGDVVDVIGYNEYFGWYTSARFAKKLPVNEEIIRGEMQKIMKDIRFRNVFGKPILISEFGAGAKKGYVSPAGPAKIWSEEYQALVYEKQVDMLSRNEIVQGMSPWILKDFRSAARELNGIQDIYNRKGLISEKGEKKKAFSVLQRFYQRLKESKKE